MPLSNLRLDSAFLTSYFEQFQMFQKVHLSPSGNRKLLNGRLFQLVCVCGFLVDSIVDKYIFP